MPLRTTRSRSTKTLAPQQVVDLVLARAVAAHQPLERGDLVLRVVVDVHVGVLAQPGVHEVDELLERGALLVAVRRVERREARARRRGSPRGTRARRSRPRTGCPRSRRRGRRARARAAARSRRRARARSARSARGRARGPRAGARPAGAASRRSPARARAAAAPAAPGRARRAWRCPAASSFSICVRRMPATRERWSIASQCSSQSALKSQTPQWSFGQGSVGRRVGDEPLEPRAHAAVVGAELLRPERHALAGAEHDVDLPRLAPGDPPELLAVEAELEDVARLRAASELGVDAPRRSRRAAARRSPRARASGRCAAPPGRRPRRRHGSRPRSRRLPRPSRRPRARSCARRARRRGATRGRPPRARRPSGGSARPAGRAPRAASCRRARA